MVVISNPRETNLFTLSLYHRSSRINLFLPTLPAALSQEHATTHAWFKEDPYEKEGLTIALADLVEVKSSLVVLEIPEPVI